MDLLDHLLSLPIAEPESPLERFLQERSPWRALAAWIKPGKEWSGPDLKQRVISRLNCDLARIDALLNEQVNAIIHHRSFQRLEASWRGLHFLVHRIEDGTAIKVRVLNVTWKELTRDLERALEFDQSQLFRKVYNEEFGTPGGEPYGLLLADYELRHKPAADHPTDDTAALGKIAEVAAASFAPFIAAVDPMLFEFADFTELEIIQNLPRLFDHTDYVKWRAMRDSEDSRFVGLVLPRVLARLPYSSDGGRDDQFPFREDVSNPDRAEYLWGNAIYAFGSVVIRSFAESGWPSSIRGVSRDVDGGGLVVGLPAHHFGANPRSVAPKTSTEVLVTDAREKELGELGFIALCHCADTELCTFYGNQSLQKPKVYEELTATMNSRLSSMLQYMLCVARFAHYLKVLARDKVGSFMTPEECEDFLMRWLRNYIMGRDDASPEMKARYPLREGTVKVREIPGKPGCYQSEIHLKPHYQLDQMVGSVRLMTELNQQRQV
jgi:type VI secretion system protein ImpD